MDHQFNQVQKHQPMGSPGIQYMIQPISPISLRNIFSVNTKIRIGSQSLNPTWGFNASYPSIVRITISGLSLTQSATNDLLFAFSNGGTSELFRKYISAMIKLDESGSFNNKISQNCSGTASLNVGDIETIVEQSTVSLWQAVLGVDATANKSDAAYEWLSESGQASPGTDWPISFEIENNPITDKSKISLITSNGQVTQYCEFNEKFPYPNEGLDVYINADEQGQSAGDILIEQFDFEYWEILPTASPTNYPTNEPTTNPTNDPTHDPTDNPTRDPTPSPTPSPTNNPTKNPTTAEPTNNPTDVPTNYPTTDPTDDPTNDPTTEPTNNPTTQPTFDPTDNPTFDPTDDPTDDPTIDPTNDPTTDPTNDPTESPTESPTLAPNSSPTGSPTESPTYYPTHKPTRKPTPRPTERATPTTSPPTRRPTQKPTLSPTPEVAGVTAIAVSVQQWYGVLAFAGAFVVLFLVVSLIQNIVIRKEKKRATLSEAEDRDGDGRKDEFDVSGLNVFEEDAKRLMEEEKKRKEREQKVKEWFEENETDDGIIKEVPVDPELSWGAREAIREQFEAQFEGSHSSDL